MKIGTDGVLLGAWATINHNPFAILDIGTGTGVIALMLAQRSNAEVIDAIEIDDDAYEQSVENFENSPWGDRLFSYHASLNEFAEEIDDTYDLIVSNPPFYSEDLTGIFAVIIPYKEEDHFITLATYFNLYPEQVLRVKGNPTSGIKRSLLQFSFNNKKEKIVSNELIIETERHKYTQDYVNLTKDFYLKM